VQAPYEKSVPIFKKLSTSIPNLFPCFATVREEVWDDNTYRGCIFIYSPITDPKADFFSRDNGRSFCRSGGSERVPSASYVWAVDVTQRIRLWGLILACHGWVSHSNVTHIFPSWCNGIVDNKVREEVCWLDY
jgi:hypothetical protein